MYKTENWIDSAKLEDIRKKYEKTYQSEPLSYATVRDFCDSFDHIHPLATANGDLKDVQRPWMLKAILGKVKPGSRVLEIGAGEPFVADLLNRLGYEVWIVDPYDGSGNGPVDLAYFSAQCPAIRFIQAEFSDNLPALSESFFDCIYSISVLEHIPIPGLLGVAQGLKKYLKPDGVSIHAVDHVHRGAAADGHLHALEFMTSQFGLDLTQLTDVIRNMEQDTETYYLSAESHNRWRAGVPYDRFPMRICVSIQLVSNPQAVKR